MKKMLLLAAFALCAASCIRPPAVDPIRTPFTDNLPATRCYTCQTVRIAYPCTVITIDTVCGMTAAGIRAYEAAHSYTSGTDTVSVYCR